VQRFIRDGPRAGLIFAGLPSAVPDLLMKAWQRSRGGSTGSIFTKQPYRRSLLPAWIGEGGIGVPELIGETAEPTEGGPFLIQPVIVAGDDSLGKFPLPGQLQSYGSGFAPCLGCGEFAFQVPVGGLQFENGTDSGQV
jgi:hypothetical protein